MKPYVMVPFDCPVPGLDIVDQPRAGLVGAFLSNADGEEESYLADIASVQAGAAPIERGDGFVDAVFYPEGHVIITDTFYSKDYEANKGPGHSVQISLAEAKQLILDWLQVKQQYWQSRERA